MSNKIKQIIAGDLLITFSAIFLICCSYSKNSSELSFKEMYQVKVFFSFPTLDASNKFIVVKDSLYIIYYKDLAIYKYPYTTEHSSNFLDNNGDIVKHELTGIDTNYRYLIYKMNARYGYAFDSIKAETGKKVRVDSFLKDRFLLVDKYIFNSRDSLVRKTTSAGNIIQETYIRTTKSDMWDCDTNHLFFSNNLKDIDFSLSKSLDSLRRIKLVKIHQISNRNIQNENPFFRQKREFIMELPKSPINNNKETLSLFEKFSKSD